MHRYCAAYFACVDMWLNLYSANAAILLNRVQLIETACMIFKDLTTAQETRNYVLVAENENVETLPEAQPLASIAFKVGDDKIAFEEAQQKYPYHVFQRSGVYFQAKFLKALAGFSEAELNTTNSASRESMLIAVEKLFRLPEAAGNARFQYRVVTETVNEEWEMIDVAMVWPSPEANTFSKFLIHENITQQRVRERERCVSSDNAAHHDIQSQLIIT